MTSIGRADAASARSIPNAQNVQTADTLDEAVHVASQCIHPHRLRVVQRCEPGSGLRCVVSALDLGDCALAYVQYGHDVQIDPGVISEYFLLKSTVRGEGRITCGDHTVTSAPNAIITTATTERTGILMTAQCRHLTARISRRALESRIAEKLGRQLPTPLRFELALPSDSAFGLGWHQLLAHICELSASAPAVLASEDVRRQYSRTMIEMLIHSGRHNYSDVLAEADSERGLPWHVRRARDYVHAHIAEVRSVAELASSVGVTARTLQNGFRQAFGMAPAEYLRRVRIEALHRALLSAGDEHSVTDLMQGVGIVNFGRYARYYRRQIGVAPSVTLKRGA